MKAKNKDEEKKPETRLTVNEEDPVIKKNDKIMKTAFMLAIIGVCSIGVFPPLGLCGIIIPLVMKAKKAPLGDYGSFVYKKAIAAGIISLVMTAVDVGIILLVLSRVGA